MLRPKQAEDRSRLVTGTGDWYSWDVGGLQSFGPSKRRLGQKVVRGCDERRAFLEDMMSVCISRSSSVINHDQAMYIEDCRYICMILYVFFHVVIVLFL